MGRKKGDRSQSVLRETFRVVGMWKSIGKWCHLVSLRLFFFCRGRWKEDEALE